MFFKRYPVELAVAGHASVVDPYVETSKLRDCLGSEFLHCGALAYVNLQRQCANALPLTLVCYLPELLNAPRSQYQVHTLISKFKRGAPTKSAGCTCDHHNLVP